MADILMPQTGGNPLVRPNPVAATGLPNASPQFALNYSGDPTSAVPTGARKYSLASSTLAARQAKAAAYAKGPMIIAPAWAATTPYVVGNYVTIPGGQHLVCNGAGTSGGSAPVISTSVPAGRNITDGTATWQVSRWVKSASDGNAPIVTSGASAAAVGTTEVNLNAGLTDRVSGKGQIIVASGGIVDGFAYANGPTTGSGNSTSQANAAGFTGDVFNKNTSFSAELEFIITDVCVCLTMHNGNTALFVEIDGQMVQGNPYVHGGVSGGAVKFDFGVMARRKVRCWGVGVRGVGLTTQGKLELATARDLDCVAMFGDSYWDTVNGGDNASGSISTVVYKELGFDSCVCMNVGGSGYISQNANTWNVPNLIARANNIDFLQNYYRPNHVIFGAGYNDGTNIATSQSARDALTAAALGSWRAMRTLLPNAKITVLDSWGGNSGPSADQIAVSALLQSAFNTWGDGNSKFVPLIVSAANSMLTGTGTANSALVAGNSSYLIGVDGSVHPGPLGARYIGRTVSDGIKAAWGGDY